MAAESEKKLRGKACPNCQTVLFGVDEDGIIMATSEEIKKQMMRGRLVCPTGACGQKFEMQGPGGYKGSRWVPVDEFTEK